MVRNVITGGVLQSDPGYPIPLPSFRIDSRDNILWMISAVRVFLLFAGLSFLSGIVSARVIQSIGSSRPEPHWAAPDLIKFGGPIAGFAVSILISHQLGWLALRATAWQYLKAAIGIATSIPVAVLVFIGVSVVVSITLDKLVPSFTNIHPLYIAGSYFSFAIASAVFLAATGLSLRSLTGVWPWGLIAGIYACTLLALITPSPWDRPFVCTVGGLIGVWLSRSQN